MYQLVPVDPRKEKVAAADKSPYFRIPELLMPAGSLEKLRLAYLYGADAAYCGVPRYSLRARENEFTMDELRMGVELARSLSKKIYFTVNAIPRNSKVKNFEKYLKEMAKCQPDGLIMADLGLIGIVRNQFPELPVHVSVQANTMNYAAVDFWKKVGVSRVILSRELSIREAGEIRQKIPDMELEIFVHGSICIAHSGRCFMSNYFKNRDANQGACNNACRDSYKVFITNPRQNDELMEVEESEEGTFLMNSKDLRGVEYLEEICNAGIDSIKVEGRTKGAYYAAMVAKTYKKALDDVRDGREVDTLNLKELDKVASRRYFSGFLKFGDDQSSPEEQQNRKEGTSSVRTQMLVGKFTSYDPASGRAKFIIKNKIARGDVLEVLSPGILYREFTVGNMYLKNEIKDVLSGGMGDVEIDIPFPVDENSFISNTGRRENLNKENVP